MISKGNTHNDGAKLARYLIHGWKDEKAELYQLRGFASDDIIEAFRSVHVMAEATRCEQPFFHLQVRNPEGESLTRQQWEYIANRHERMLGLSGQPRAISFHIDGKTGHEHMHIAWSRIDDETMTAKALPFFKERLKKTSRELELHFGLTLVSSERKTEVQAPTRDEFEQARRLGIDIHAVRQTIRDCYERSDNGHSFEAALADNNLTLAQGERRDFVVIDAKEGIHALGKRIIGVSASQVRKRLDDLDRDQLPTVEQARELVREFQGSREKEAEQMPDAHRYEMDWLDALAKAAIEKEKIERRFVEPALPTPEERQRRLAPELGKTGGEIRLAYGLTRTGQEFANALEDRGLIFAHMTAADAERLNRWERQRRREEWQVPSQEKAGSAPGNKPSEQQERPEEYERYQVGELVVVNQYGQIFQLSFANTGDSRKERDDHLKDIDRAALLSVTKAEGAMKRFQMHQREEREHAREQKREEAQLSIKEKLGPTKPAQPERNHWTLFQQAAGDAGRDQRSEKLGGVAAQVWDLWSQIDPVKHDRAITGQEQGRASSVATDPKDFAAALDEKGISFAAVTKSEADRSHREASFAKAAGNYAPRFREGEIVIVTEQRPEYRRAGQIIEPPRVHKLDQALAEKFVTHLEIKERLQSIDATLKTSDNRARERATDRESVLLERATKLKSRDRDFGKEQPKTLAPSLGKTAGRSIGKVFDVAATAFESLFAPKLTPEQIRQGERATRRREAEAENTVDVSRYIAESTQRRQQQENEREAERRQDRERDGGGRER